VRRLTQRAMSVRPYRVARVTASVARVAVAWWAVPNNGAKRGKVLREAVAALGPVFVKLGQTLASRADLVGDEAAEALKGLQDRMEPFPTDEAMVIMREELGLDSGAAVVGAAGSGAPFAALSELPVAAASLGQVYRGTLADGREVAVKVQRPGSYDQVGLDMYILRATLAWLKAGPSQMVLATSLDAV